MTFFDRYVSHSRLYYRSKSSYNILRIASENMTDVIDVNDEGSECSKQQW